MTQRTLKALLVAGAVVLSSAGAAVAGSEGWSKFSGWSKSSGEVQAMKAEGAAEAPVLAPNDYLEFLEAAQAIETGSLTAPGVQPTVVPGPSEKVVVPEGG